MCASCGFQREDLRIGDGVIPVATATRAGRRFQWATWTFLGIFPLQQCARVNADKTFFLFLFVPLHVY